MKGTKAWIIALAAVMLFAGASCAAAGDELAGTYRGIFVGRDDYGSFTITVDYDGLVEGIGRSNVYMIDLLISGEAQRDGSIEFYTVEGGETPIIFSGRIDFMKRILGKWAYQDLSTQGSFTAMPEVN